MRDNKLIGAMLLGDVSKVENDSVRRSMTRCRCPTNASRCRSTSEHPAPQRVPLELSDDAVVCNRNGVSKGRHRGVRASGAPAWRSMREDPRREGMRVVQGHGRRHRHPAAGSDLTVDTSADWYVPSIPMTKPELIEAIRAWTCGR